MDEHPPSIAQKILIVICTALVGLLIILGIAAAIFSSCLEIVGPIIKSGK